ncbi:unnamed protein product [Coffea canephora]|uniref:Uncharacterized protein n=1 Tax=Coffea canephora TaxID=49390 RepID=A0A068UTN8_COFCA|nr:unnamed protein product [Coffea canephora]
MPKSFPLSSSFIIITRLLVYEFMTRGSLEKHLFRSNQSSTDIINPLTSIPLPWSNRIKIALGAPICGLIIQRAVLVETLDCFWRNHPINMNRLSLIRLHFRSSGHRNPLEDYKIDGW